MRRVRDKRYWAFLLACLVLLGMTPSRTFGELQVQGFSFYEDLFREHGAVMLMINPDSGEIVFANDAASAYYGYPLEQLQGMLIGQLNTLSATDVAAEMERAVTEERNYFLFKHRLSDGSIRDVEVVSYPVNVAGEELLFSIITDVSGRIAAEALAARQQQLRLLGALGALFLAVLALAYQYSLYRGRKRALAKLEHTYALQRLAGEIAAELAGVYGQDLEPLMSSAVMKCAQFLRADQAHVVAIDQSTANGRRVFTWNAFGTVEDMEVETALPEILPWIYEKLAAGRPVLVKEAEDLPLEAATDKTYFERNGIKSKLALPIVTDGAIKAFWCLETRRGQADWTEDTAVALELLSGVFAAAIERGRAHGHLVFWQYLLSYVIEHSPASIAVLDKDMKYMFVSQRFLEDYRVPGKDIIGKSHYEVFPEVPERWREVHRRVLAGEIRRSEHEVFPRKDGTVDYTRYMLRPWQDAEGVIGGMIMYLEVITEQHRREQALRESEERFRLLVEMAPDAILLYSGYQLAYANQSAVRLLKAESVEELIGKKAMHWLHPSLKDAVRERYRVLLEDKQPVPIMEQVYVLAAGSELDVEVAAAPMQYGDQAGALVYVRDISERKKREAEKLKALLDYRQQQRLESIGTLASGVAHEINNPVMGMINYAQLILDDNPGDQAADYAKAIIGEGERVAEITRALLFYSRQEKQAHSPARIEDIIGRTIALVSKLFAHDQISMEVNIEPGLPDLKCRSQQVQQVVMNLLTNARDALNERFPEYHADKKIGIHVDMFREEGRRWIRITVEDRGKGIPADVGDRIFDPFFTSKSRDAGTGLGLPISQGIAQDHHGRIRYESIPGEQTRFYLELPIDNGWRV